MGLLLFPLEFIFFLFYVAFRNLSLLILTLKGTFPMNFTLIESIVQKKFIYDNSLFLWNVLLLFNYKTNIITPPPQLLIDETILCVMIFFSQWFCGEECFFSFHKSVASVCSVFCFFHCLFIKPRRFCYFYTTGFV